MISSFTRQYHSTPVLVSLPITGIGHLNPSGSRDVSYEICPFTICRGLPIFTFIQASQSTTAYIQPRQTNVQTMFQKPPTSNPTGIMQSCCHFLSLLTFQLHLHWPKEMELTGARSGEYGGWGGSRHFSFLITAIIVLAV